MTSRVIPMCITCVHLHDNDDTSMTCDAFPAGIPLPIIDSEADHRLPYPGDRGIMYEHDPETPDYDFSSFDQIESPTIRP